MSLSEQSIERLRMVKDAILKEPYLYDQDTFGSQGPSCETPCCIAGHAAHLAGKKRGQNTSEVARKWIGLTVDQASDLFWDHWPKGCDSPAWQEPRTIAAAEDGAFHIELFISNGGKW